MPRKKRKKLSRAGRVRLAQRSVVQAAYKKKAGVHDRFKKGYNRARSKSQVKKQIDDEG